MDPAHTADGLVVGNVVHEDGTSLVRVEIGGTQLGMELEPRVARMVAAALLDSADEVDCLRDAPAA